MATLAWGTNETWVNIKNMFVSRLIGILTHNIIFGVSLCKMVIQFLF